MVPCIFNRELSQIGLTSERFRTGVLDVVMADRCKNAIIEYTVVLRKTG
jgi:hypothetical protein